MLTGEGQPLNVTALSLSRHLHLGPGLRALLIRVEIRVIPEDVCCSVYVLEGQVTGNAVVVYVPILIPLNPRRLLLTSRSGLLPNGLRGWSGLTLRGRGSHRRSLLCHRLRLGDGGGRSRYLLRLCLFSGSRTKLGYRLRGLLFIHRKKLLSELLKC